MLRAKHMGFKSVRRVEVKAETTTPGEARGGAVDAASARAGASRGRRTLPRLEFTVDEDGAVLHGPQRGAYPFLGAAGDAERELAASFRALHMRELADENERDNGGSTAAVDGDQEEGEDNQVEEDDDEERDETERKPAPMKECILNDTRATTLAIKYDRGVGKFVCGSSIERFSGHTGVCRVLGSKKYPIIPHSLRIGDLLRIGSVGLVVCEINRTASEETLEALSEEEYEFLKENYLSLPLQQTFHPTDSRGAQMDDEDDRADDKDDCARTRRVGGETSDEGESEEDARAGRDSAGADGQGGGTKDGSRTMGVAGVVGKRFCYICYDGDEEPEENPLVAPCDCKGDTKYVHLECLQRWNNNLDAEGNNPNQKVCAVTNTDGLDVCSICKATYLTSVRLDDGRVVSLLAKKLPPPYVTFAVVTQHETRNRSTALTNTRFQLSFANLPRGQQYLTIGRSTTNNMTLRYRTVSQLHAKIKFQDGHFFLFDASSSNGTMLFLSKPLELDWNKTMHVKIGRTILTLKSKKKWKWTGASEDDADSDGEGVSSPRASGVGTPREGGESTPRASSFRAPTPRHPGQNRFEPDGILSDPSAELLSPFRGIPTTLPVEPLASDIQDGSEDSPTTEAPATLVHSPQVRTAPLADDPELPESFNLSEIDDDVQNASTSDSHPAEDNQQQQSTSFRAFMPGNPRASPPEAPGLNGGGTPLGLLQGRVADLPRMRNELRQRREHMLFDLVDSLALIDSLERMPMRRPTASTRAVAPPRRLPHARRPSSASRPEQQQ